MRLATILSETGTTPVPAVFVGAHTWVSLDSFLGFFGVRDLPRSTSATLADFLPILMPRFSEFTRKVSDWPEHGRVFQGRGGKTLRSRRFFPPIVRPSTFRDFYGFEQHGRRAGLV